MMKRKRVQLLEFIGVGGSCTVYKGLLLPCDGATADPPDRQTFVAVKVYYVPSGDPYMRAVLQQATDRDLSLLKQKARPVGDTPFIVQLYGTGSLHLSSSGNSSSSPSGSDSSSSSSFRFAVLELGVPLYPYLSRTGPAHPRVIKLVMWQLLDAVSHLHNGGSFMIIHKDLKPENILLLTTIHKVKLMDFNGAAMVERSQPGSSMSTAAGSSSSSSSHS
jgi:serine/threonine protein kinase